MTKRVRWDRGASSTALVFTALVASTLLLALACGAKSSVPPGRVDTDDRNAWGGSRGIPDASAGTAGTSGTGFSGSSGALNGGAGPVGGTAGQGGSGGAGPVGGAGQGGSFGGAGSGGQAGSAGQAGSDGTSDRGVVAAWAGDRWVVATPREDSRALVLYEVSEGGALLSGPREVELEDPPVRLTLVDAARSPSTGQIGIVADSAFLTVAEGLDSATVNFPLDASNCFLRRIEHALELFVFVSVRLTFEGTITVLETPGVIDGNPGFHQKELLFLRTDCRSLAFAPWLNPDGGLGVDFMYARPTTEGVSLTGYRLYDRNGSTWGSTGLGNLLAPVVLDLDAPARLDLARSGTRSVASFRDAAQNGTRYLLIDEYAFTVVDEVVQHAPLRLAAPMKGDDEGFAQAVVIDGSPRFLELRELWYGDRPYQSLTLAIAEVVAVHLARGPDLSLALPFRVAVSPNSQTGSVVPGLYVFGRRPNGEAFFLQLPDM